MTPARFSELYRFGIPSTKRLRAPLKPCQAGPRPSHCSPRPFRAVGGRHAPGCPKRPGLVDPGGGVRTDAPEEHVSSIARYPGDLSGLGEPGHSVSGFREASARRPSWWPPCRCMASLPFSPSTRPDSPATPALKLCILRTPPLECWLNRFQNCLIRRFSSRHLAYHDRRSSNKWRASIGHNAQPWRASQARLACELL